MNISHLWLTATLTGILATGTLNAAPDEAANARADTLYQANCLSCHGSEVYTRPNRMVESLEGLERQVQRCETTIGLRWFDEDIQDVTAYLNHHFYRFEP
jgi:mono/diheme cytochrome c family protein